MNTKIGTSFGLALLMAIAAIATMFALGLFGPANAYADAPSPKSITASPSSPGDGASIKIGFETDTEIVGNSGELWVGFDAKYGVPISIPRTSISIASGQTTGGVSSPLIDPTVAKQIAASSPLSAGDWVVKLQLGDTAPNTTATVEGLSTNVGGNDHFVTFATSAGITLPTEANTQGIWLSKDSGATWSTATITAGTNGITVARELTLSATSGARGKSVTATGKGFTTTGSATLWIDTNDDGVLDSGEFVIASGIVVSGGLFTHAFTTDTSFPLSTVAINAKGGDGSAVSSTTNPTFLSFGSITLDKTSVSRGGSLQVTARDHQAGLISSITIGGVNVTLPTDKTIDTTGVDEAFTVTIPASAPLGLQKISMTSANEGSPTARYTTVTITGAPVTVSPSTAVAGQEVTVTGTGFTKGDDLATITVGGQTVTFVSSGGLNTSSTIASDVAIDSSGNFSTSFLVPNTSTTRTAGSHKILVTDDGNLAGEVFLVVPARTLTLNVVKSKRGSEVTVTGTGYEALGSVALTYLSGTTSTALGSSTANSDGGFTKVVTIPNSASIPSTNTITGAISGGGSQTASHEIPPAEITLDLAEQVTGGSLTITGSGFPSYAVVSALTVGGLDTRPVPSPSTDVDGGFTTTVLVPGINSGSHNVSVTAGSVTGSRSLRVVSTTAVVIPVSTATQDIFADVIANADNLVRVWRFSNATQSWDFYDPRPAFATANTLAKTGAGDIVWVNVNTEQTFQGQTLFPGWNLISLK